MPRTTAENDKIKEERRQNILSGALLLFATKGLVATKISDIAKQTGMSQGLVYHYFSCKEDIYTELIGTAFEKLLEACDSLESMEISAHDKVNLAIQGLLKGIKQNEDTACYHLLIAQASANDAIPEAAKSIITTNNKTPYKIIGDIFKRGQEEGTVKKHDSKQLAILFWSTINGLAIHRFSHGEKALLPSSELIASIFLEG